jgi:hypothetical protein
LVEWNIVRCNPAHPGEVAESGEEITWDKVPKSRKEKGVDEEPFSTDPSMGPYPAVVLGMKSVE